MEIPVYLFLGLLDSGKTTFIDGVLEEGFADSRTLLIRCEQGDVEYTHLPPTVTLVNIEDEADLKCSLLKKLEKEHKPQQIIIEWNGMWQLGKLEAEILPSNWLLYQIMTFVEAATFDTYARNFGQLMMEKLACADMIVFNRCTPELAAALRRRNLKMVNRRAAIYLEYLDESTEDYFTGDESPFDLDQAVVEIPDEDFGLFYVDTMEHPERYDGKTVHLKMVMCHVGKYPDIAVPGRFAMTCCADDITFFGMVATGENLKAIETREWVDVTAVMGTTEHELYGDSVGPLLRITSAEICEKPDEEVVTF
jgi:hypothetical protein